MSDHPLFNSVPWLDVSGMSSRLSVPGMVDIDFVLGNRASGVAVFYSLGGLTGDTDTDILGVVIV